MTTQRSENPTILFIHGSGPTKHAHDNLFDAIFGCALKPHATPYPQEDKGGKQQ